MRIRKHAKISPLVYIASSLEPGTVLTTPNECKLNQSPWDVIDFSSSSHLYANSSPPSSLCQFDEDESFLGNGSFCDSIGAVESVASLKSVNHDGVAAVEGDVEMVVEPLGLKNDIPKKIAKNGNNDNDLARANAGEFDKPGRPRGRPRLKKTSPSSNPDVYYYYSEFGPGWGKKRGQKRHELDNNDEARNVSEPSSSSSQIDNQEFDYLEDEEDENNGENRMKRARKPIKARSLKSLM